MGVHGVCGAIGTILTGVFAVDGGLAYGAYLLGVQTLGVVTVMACGYNYYYIIQSNRCYIRLELLKKKKLSDLTN
ncbi:MAG: hypothetical protein ACLS23_07935 [Clostridioides difficile]